MTEQGQGTVLEINTIIFDEDIIEQVVLKVTPFYHVTFNKAMFPETVKIGDRFGYRIANGLVQIL